MVDENNLVTSLFFFLIFTLSLHCVPFHGHENFKFTLSSLEAPVAGEKGTNRKLKSQFKGRIKNDICCFKHFILTENTDIHTYVPIF